MAADSPSVLLQRAANKLAEMAEATTSGTWQARSLPREEHMANVVVGTEATTFGSLFGSSCCGGHCYGHVNEAGDATWIAVMSPAVAAPLVAWLREAADAFSSYGDMPAKLMQSDEVGSTYRHTYRFMQGALEFARLILGEAL